MTYVMGLEAAKTRPATEDERAEMRRLLAEGMDAGLVRILDPAARAGFDAGRLRRIADGHRHDVRRGHPQSRARAARARRGLHRRSRRRPGISRRTSRFVERLAAEANRPILHNAIAPARHDPKVHQRSLAWLKRCREKGLPIFGQTATLRTGFAFTLENWNLYDASPAWRTVTTGSNEEKIAKMKDPALREAIKREHDEANKKLEAIQAGVGGPIRLLIVRGRATSRSSRSMSANRSAKSRRKKTSTRST